MQRLKGLRPIDDDFMRCLFKDNIELVEFVLRIITGKEDLVITECQTQKDTKRLVGARYHSSVLDVENLNAGQEFRLKELIWRQANSLRMESIFCMGTVNIGENLKGVDEMCKSLEEMRNETAENTLLQTIKNLMETMKWSAEQAMAAMKIPTSEQEKYKARL